MIVELKKAVNNCILMAKRQNMQPIKNICQSCLFTKMKYGDGVKYTCAPNYKNNDLINVNRLPLLCL